MSTESKHGNIEMTSREVFLIKDALMKQVVSLGSKQAMAKTGKQRHELKTLKLETFAVYQKLY